MKRIIIGLALLSLVILSGCAELKELYGIRDCSNKFDDYDCVCEYAEYNTTNCIKGRTKTPKEMFRYKCKINNGSIIYTYNKDLICMT